MAKKAIRDKWLWVQSLITVAATCLLAIVLNGALSASGAALAPSPQPTAVTHSAAPSSPSEGV